METAGEGVGLCFLKFLGARMQNLLYAFVLVTIVLGFWMNVGVPSASAIQHYFL